MKIPNFIQSAAGQNIEKMKRMTGCILGRLADHISSTSLPTHLTSPAPNNHLSPPCLLSQPTQSTSSAQQPSSPASHPSSPPLARPSLSVSQTPASPLQMVLSSLSPFSYLQFQFHFRFQTRTRTRTPSRPHLFFQH